VDFQILYTEPAIADLEEILFYSWSKFPGAAERFAVALLNHVDLLKSFPYVGSPVTGLPGVRQLVHTPILIYYRVDEDRKCVDILHFWHAARKRPEI
jgi:plasmid stabilization system protein ParE